MKGEGRGKTECHFLLTNSPRRLFFIPPLLLVIAQSSHIHLTGRFTHSSTAVLSQLFSVFQVQHYYWYFFSVSAASNHPPPLPCTATPTPPLCSPGRADCERRPVPGFIRENRKTNNEAHNDSGSCNILRFQFCGAVPREMPTFISPSETQTAVS